MDGVFQIIWIKEGESDAMEMVRFVMSYYFIRRYDKGVYALCKGDGVKFLYEVFLLLIKSVYFIRQ